MAFRLPQFLQLRGCRFAVLALLLAFSACSTPNQASNPETKPLGAGQNRLHQTQWDDLVGGTVVRIAPNTMMRLGDTMFATGGLQLEPTGKQTELRYHLNRQCNQFRVSLGLDASADDNARVRFQIFLDGDTTPRINRGPMGKKALPDEFALDVTDRKELRVVAEVDPQSKGRVVADLADAQLICKTTETSFVPQADTVAPTVRSVYPWGASIDPSTYLAVAFDEAMDTASVTITTVPAIAFNRATWATNGMWAKFVPKANMPNGTPIQVTVTGTDLAGNALTGGLKTWTFTTSGTPPPSDTTPPTINYVVPTGSNVDGGSYLAAEFNEAMNPASVSVSVTPSLALGAATWNGTSTYVKYQPTSAMQANTTYTMTVTGKDVAGNNVTGTTSFGWTTAATVVVTPPPPPSPPAPTNNYVNYVDSPDNLADLSTWFGGASMSPVKSTVAVSTSEDSDGFLDHLNATAGYMWWQTYCDAFVGETLEISLMLAGTTGSSLTLNIVSHAGPQLAGSGGSYVAVTPTPQRVVVGRFTKTSDGFNDVRLVLGGITPRDTIYAGGVRVSKIVPDTTAPTISASAPSGSAVAVNAPLEVTFSEAMNTSTVTLGLAPTVAGTSTWNTANTKLTFTPSSNLANATAYTATIGGKDVAGNAMAAASYTFTTVAAADTTPPTVTASAPSGTSVAIAAPLELTFSEAMNPSTVTLGIVPSVAGTSVWNAANTKITFTPTNPLAYSTNYTVTANGKDVAGNAMDASSYAFQTTVAPDTTPPTMTASTPSGNAVSVGSSLGLTFSEAMDTSSVVVNSTPSLSWNTPTWNAGNTVLSLTPTAPLAYSTAYTISVSGKDLAGNALGTTTYSFTTSGAPDTTAPTVTTSTPTGASVAIAAPLEVTFSEAMNPSSVTLGITPSVAGTSAWNAANTKITFTPTNPLAHSTAYTVTVNGKDVAGNAMTAGAYSFTTVAPPDTTPPTITTNAPSGTSVALAAPVVLEFSESIDPATFVVSSNPSVVLGSATWNSNHTSVSLAASWAYSTAYTITVAANDEAGNALAGTKTYSFTTVAPPDTTAPSITATTPTGTSVAVGSNISITFSEPMNPASVAATLSPSTNLGAGVWSNGNTVLTFDPPSDLANATTYTLGVTGQDLAGNALPNAPKTFTTALAAVPFGVVQHGSIEIDMPFWMGQDASGNLVVVLETSNDIDGTGPNAFAGVVDIAVLKFSPAGALLLAKQFGSSNEEVFSSAQILGNTLYVAGMTTGDVDGAGPNAKLGGQDGFLAQLNLDTGALGLSQFGSAQDENISDVAVDASGNAIVVGDTLGNMASVLGGYDAFALKISGAGVIVWTRQFGTTNNEGASDVIVNSDGSTFVAGLTKGVMQGSNAGNYDVFLSKFASDGTLQFTQQSGSSLDDEPRDLIADGTGGVYVGGLWNRETTGFGPGEDTKKSDIFLTHYNASGTQVFQTQLVTPDKDVLVGMTKDASNNVYVAGFTYRDIDGAGPGVNAGGADAFVAKYSAAGSALWLKQFGGTGDEVLSSIGSVGNDIVVTGHTNGDVDGAGPNSNAGQTDAMLARFDQNGNTVFLRQFGSTGNDSAVRVAPVSGGLVALGQTNGDIDGAGPGVAGYWPDVFLMGFRDNGTR